MKKLLNNKIVQVGLMAFLVIVSAILFAYILRSVNSIISFIGFIFNILMPLIVGLVLAYIMHPIVGFFEKKVFKKIHGKNMRRNLSITCTIVVILAVLSTLISIIIPQLLLSIQSLIVNVPNYINLLEDTIKNWISNSDIQETVMNNYDTIANNLLNSVNTVILPSIDTAIEKIGLGITGFLTSIINLAIGTVFACYILANTKNFAAGIRKTLYSFFDIEKVNKFVGEVQHVNRIFSNFMLGKICDSSMVALLTFLFLIIFKFPYPLLIAVIIGLTDLIPYFGPYIGSIPSALLICLVSPVKALTFVLFMVVLQQIDGNFITPRIQKQATGLPSFWVLFAITFFGGLFGIVGMLIGVPCFTIIYEIIVDYINSRLSKKNMPTDTTYYENNRLEEKVIKSRLISKKINSSK